MNMLKQKRNLRTFGKTAKINFKERTTNFLPNQSQKRQLEVHSIHLLLSC